MRRTVQDELLDQDLGTPAEVADSLRDLRMFNRYFGGIRAGHRLLRRVARATAATRLSLLDVGSASGDVATALRRRLAREGVELSLTLLDRVASHFDGRNGHGDARRVQGDALALPFRDAAVDVVNCGLFAHHLESDELVAFLNDALRVARHAVVINDVCRSPVHLALVYAGLPLYASRLTRHDAPASVRRAYTAGEMRAIVERTQAHRVEYSRHYLYRLGVIAWKR